MFTKEKLEKWIGLLENILGFDFAEETYEDLTDLKHTLESMLATIDNEEI